MGGKGDVGVENLGNVGRHICLPSQSGIGERRRLESGESRKATRHRTDGYLAKRVGERRQTSSSDSFNAYFKGKKDICFCQRAA